MTGVKDVGGCLFGHEFNADHAFWSASNNVLDFLNFLFLTSKVMFMEKKMEEAGGSDAKRYNSSCSVC